MRTFAAHYKIQFSYEASGLIDQAQASTQPRCCSHSVSRCHFGSPDVCILVLRLGRPSSDESLAKPSCSAASACVVSRTVSSFALSSRAVSGCSGCLRRDGISDGTMVDLRPVKGQADLHRDLQLSPGSDPTLQLVFRGRWKEAFLRNGELPVHYFRSSPRSVHAGSQFCTWHEGVSRPRFVGQCVWSHWGSA